MELGLGLRPIINRAYANLGYQSLSFGNTSVGWPQLHQIRGLSLAIKHILVPTLPKGVGLSRAIFAG